MATAREALVRQRFSLIKANSSTTIGNGFTVIYDGVPHGVSATATGVGGLNQSVAVSYNPGGSTTQNNPGSYTATATHPGDANHLGSSAGPGTINITFGVCSIGPGGVILPPINSDGTSVYKRQGGSTIPVKFRVCGASGAAISNSAAVFAGTGGTLTMLSAVRGTVDAVNETTSGDIPDAAFRWDASSQWSGVSRHIPRIRFGQKAAALWWARRGAVFEVMCA